jgi:hypothetical protein
MMKKLNIGSCCGEIDPGIKGLIDAMNQTGYIQTFVSCEGHKKDDNPYVGFACRTSQIKKLCKILNKVMKSLDIFLELNIILPETVLNCQDDMPKGYLSLDLTFMVSTNKVKIQAFKMLEDCFKEV